MSIVWPIGNSFTLLYNMHTREDAMTGNQFFFN
jgi:hypothetical protein